MRAEQIADPIIIERIYRRYFHARLQRYIYSIYLLTNIMSAYSHEKEFHNTKH